jgi:hypothetical protein
MLDIIVRKLAIGLFIDSGSVQKAVSFHIISIHNWEITGVVT